jgi:hypothetical protein
MRIELAAALAALLALGGCATITRGTTQAWTINSDPIGATTTLSSGERCNTPCALNKKRKYPFNVELCKAGFDPVVMTIQSQVAGGGAAGMAGNVLLGGVIGMGIDASSGATKELVPNNQLIKLVPATNGGCTASTVPAIPEGGAGPDGKRVKKH